MKRCLIIVWILYWMPLSAQQNEAAEQSLISVRGDVQSRSTFSSATNQFGQILSGNLVFRIKNRELPFSWTYSERKNTFTHPFNQFRFAPEWKNVKFQAGHCQFFHSAYTLNGAPVFGLGAEVKGRKFTHSILGGAIRRKTKADVLSEGQMNNPQRNIVAASLRYEENKLMVHTNLNLCWDLTERGESFYFSNTQIPQSGFAGSLGVNKEFKNGVFFQSEQAFSLVNASRYTEGGYSEFYTINATGDLSTAGKYQLGFRKKSEFVLSHERIQKAFHPLSQFYALSDLSVSAVEGRMNFKANKIRIRLKGGYQSALSNRNHKRFASAFQFSITPSKKSSHGINYSGFTSISVFNTRSEYEETLYPDDSLRLFQVQHSVQVNSMFSPDKKSRHRFSLHGQAAFGDQLKGEDYSSAYKSGVSSRVFNCNANWNRKSKNGKCNTTLGISNSFNGNEKFSIEKTGLTHQTGLTFKKGGKLSFGGILARRADPVSNHRLSYSREWSGFARSKIRLNFSLSQRVNLVKMTSENIMLCMQLSVHFS